MSETDLDRAVDGLLAAYHCGSVLEDLPAACRPGSVTQAVELAT